MSETKHYESIILKKEEGVGWLTLNRPHRLNTLTTDMIDEMNLALNDFEADKEIKCIVITGTGEKAFSAGADVTAFTGVTPATAVEASSKGQALYTRLERISKPVIASLNGYALGGGLEMASACDFRIASEDAQLGQPEINLGLIPGWGGTQRLVRLVGLARAKQMIMLGDRISAEEAAKIGLVNKVVPKAKLHEETLALAKRLADGPPRRSKIGKGNVKFRNPGALGYRVEIGSSRLWDNPLHQGCHGRHLRVDVKEETGI